MPRTVSFICSCRCSWPPHRCAVRTSSAGPMLGHVTGNSARVWMQFSEAGQLTMTAIDVRTPTAVSGVRLDIDGPSPFLCDVPIQNLRPDRSYRLEFKFDGTVLKVPDFIVRTAPVPGDEAAFAIAFGSDISTAPPVKAPAARVASANIRASRSSPPSPAPNRASFSATSDDSLPRSTTSPPPTATPSASSRTFTPPSAAPPALQQIVTAMPVYAVFSDHDFGPTGATGNYVFANESLVAFQKFWPNPDWGTPQNPGCYTTLSLGDVNSSCSTPGPSAADPLHRRTARHPTRRARPLRRRQLDWLKKGLKESKAHFKFIAAPCTLWGDAPGRPDADSWSSLSKTRDRCRNDPRCSPQTWC